MPTETDELIVRHWIEEKLEEMGEDGFSFYLAKADFETQDLRNRVDAVAGEMGLIHCSDCGSEKMYNSSRKIVVCPFCE